MRREAVGFTVVELIIVVVTIGILAMIALVRFGGVTESGRASVAYVTLSNIIGAEKAYYWDAQSPAYTEDLTDVGFTSTFDDYFNYAFNNTSSSAFALRKSSGSGRLSYRMDLNGAKSSKNQTTMWP